MNTERIAAANDVWRGYKFLMTMHSAGETERTMDFLAEAFTMIDVMEQLRDRPTLDWEEQAGQAWRILHRAAMEIQQEKFLPDWVGVREELCAAYPDMIEYAGKA